MSEVTWRPWSQESSAPIFPVDSDWYDNIPDDIGSHPRNYLLYVFLGSPAYFWELLAYFWGPPAYFWELLAYFRGSLAISGDAFTQNCEI